MSKKLAILGPAFFTLVVFFFLLIAEILVLAGLQGSFPNSTSSPFYEFRNLAVVAWTQNPWEITLEWLTQPVLEIGFRGDSTGLYSWAIYYHIPAIISHLVVALIFVFYFTRRSNKTRSSIDLVLMASASIFIIIPTFYLNIAAHCSGATWIVNVIIRAMQSSAVNTSFMLQRLAIDVPVMFTILQWAFVASGVLTYFILYRRSPGSFINKQVLNSPT